MGRLEMVVAAPPVFRLELGCGDQGSEKQGGTALSARWPDMVRMDSPGLAWFLKTN